jgi:hypothetical protein
MRNSFIAAPPGLSPVLELGKSPGFMHFHLWIGAGSTYLRPAELGGSQVDPGLVIARQYNGASAKSQGFL